jgi:hypothetical protein
MEKDPLLAADRVSLRRAAVLAYIGNLLSARFPPPARNSILPSTIPRHHQH